jgi:hypothetical protein
LINRILERHKIISKDAKRQTPIGNRQSAIGNRQCYE